MTNRTRKWIRAGTEVLIHGGTSALISSITASLVDSDHFPLFSMPFLKMFGAGFIGNGGIRFLQWWQANPLPPDGDTGQILADGGSLVPQQVISLNPLAKVQTMSVPIEANKPQ